MQGKEGPAVTATMTWVGFDVHARSTHGAAIDRESGELTRARFGVGVGLVVAQRASAAGACLHRHVLRRRDLRRLRLQRHRHRQSTSVRLPGYGGANNNDAAVVAFLQGRNTVSAGSGAASNTVPTGGGYTGGAACTQPTVAP